MVVELLQPAGPDLVRRLAAALLLVDRADREAVVEAIERKVTETYARGRVVGGQGFTHVTPPTRREGFVEQIETEYVMPTSKSPIVARAPHEVSVSAKAVDKAKASPKRRSGTG